MPLIRDTILPMPDEDVLIPDDDDADVTHMMVTRGETILFERYTSEFCSALCCFSLKFA